MYDTGVILRHGLYTAVAAAEGRWLANWGLSLCFSALSPSCLLVHSSAHVLMSVNTVRRGRRQVCCRFQRSKHIAVVLLDARSCARAAGICCRHHVKHVWSLNADKKIKSPAEVHAKTERSSWRECGICKCRFAECYKSFLFFLLLHFTQWYPLLKLREYQ